MELLTKKQFLATKVKHKEIINNKKMHFFNYLDGKYQIRRIRRDKKDIVFIVKVHETGFIVESGKLKGIENILYKNYIFDNSSKRQITTVIIDDYGYHS